MKSIKTPPAAAKALLALGLLLAAAPALANPILQTRHNLSTGGPGEPGITRAADQSQVCIFCHVPHHSTAVAPLWSRPDPDPTGSAYSPYSSLTLEAAPGQPRGSSRLCLSCHDGTIAMGRLAGGRQISALDRIPAGRSSNLSQDLSDDHPVSIPYTTETAMADGELSMPLDLAPALRLEPGGYLECRTCHDPHNDRFDKFLVMDNAGSALCTACHRKTGWSSSTHANEATLAASGCDNCHLPHNAGGDWLNRGIEEETCLNCHSDTGTASDIQSLLGRLSSHPVETAIGGTHDPGEDPLGAGPHVECTDCHNPHAANGGAPLVSGGVSGRTLAIKGVDANGGLVSPATLEYQVCFRCHADNSFVLEPAVSRQLPEVNERLRFDPGNPSFHPVIEARNAGLPGLQPGYSSASIITCTDCHNSDEGIRAGGTGPDGPHGSNFSHLLIARYEKGEGLLPYVQDNFALCFRCHDPLALFDSGISGFSDQHRNHVQLRGISCAVCHDPHGVPWVLGGNGTDNARLVNFDTDVVTTGSFDSFTHSCTVSCHSSNPRSY